MDVGWRGRTPHNVVSKAARVVVCTSRIHHKEFEDPQPTGTRDWQNAHGLYFDKRSRTIWSRTLAACALASHIATPTPRPYGRIAKLGRSVAAMHDDTAVCGRGGPT